MLIKFNQYCFYKYENMFGEQGLLFSQSSPNYVIGCRNDEVYIHYFDKILITIKISVECFSQYDCFYVYKDFVSRDVLYLDYNYNDFKQKVKSLFI